MRSESFLSVLSLVCALAMLSCARAQAQDGMKVLMRLTGAADRTLLPRVRGQLSDVSVALIAVETAPLEETFAEQVQAAHALATERGGDVVLWFASGEAGFLVHVATPGNERILTRRLVDGGKVDSGLMEEAALAVRSAVTALAAGGGIGVSTAEALAEEAPEKNDDVDVVAVEHVQPPLAAEVVQPERDVVEPEAEPATGEATPLTARVLVGLAGVIDGQSSLGQQGLYARAGVGFGALALHVYGTASLAARVDDPYFTLHIARHSAGAAISVRTQLARAASAWVGGHAGAVLLHRSSEAKSATVRVTPASLTAAWACGPELGVDWMFGRYGLGMLLALDVLPSAPRFESAGVSSLGARDAHRLWTVEPRLGIGLEAALP